MSYFLALDAGGTKTQCWLGDEERILGRSTGETIKLMNVGEETATRRLGEIVIQAAKSAGIGLEQIQRTCIGLAGISSESVRVWADTTLRGLVSGEILLVGDEEIALAAAFHGGPGVLVIAGTGSHVVGRCGDGTRTTVGGWGPVAGDEGSGTWIGLEALRAGFRALDRGEKTSVLEEAQGFWGLQSLGELIALVNGRSRADFAALTGVVVRCAEAGDAVAQDVLERAGEELAGQVGLTLSKMVECGCAVDDGSRVAFTGSVLEKIPQVLASMEKHLLHAHPGLVVAKTAVEPLEGAMWLARGSGASG